MPAPMQTFFLLIVEDTSFFTATYPHHHPLGLNLASQYHSYVKRTINTLNFFPRSSTYSAVDTFHSAQIYFVVDNFCIFLSASQGQT